MAATRPSRREQLLEATVEYLLAHGVNGLSLRPLAAAIGTKARLLIYHFGSRDELVSAAMAVVLRRVQLGFLATQSEASLDRTLMGFWRATFDEENEPYVRLMLEVHGLAAHDPDLFGEYRRAALESWTSLIAERLRKRNRTARRRHDLATLIVAVVDGLLLAYLATGDRARTTRALQLFIRSLKKEKG